MAPLQATGRPPPRPSDGGEAHPAAAQPPAPRPSAARHTTVDAGGVRCGGVSTARLPTPPPARVAPPLPRTTTTGSGVGAPPAAPATTGTGGACARTMVGAGGGGRRAACKRVSGERPAPRDGKAGPATRGSGWRLRRRVALPASAGADISVGTRCGGGGWSRGRASSAGHHAHPRAAPVLRAVQKTSGPAPIRRFLLV